jgi:hypothetical protein
MAAMTGAQTPESMMTASEAAMATVLSFSIIGGVERLRGRMRVDEGSSLFLLCMNGGSFFEDWVSRGAKRDGLYMFI